MDTTGPALTGNNQQHIQQVSACGWLGDVMSPQLKVAALTVAKNLQAQITLTWG